MEAAFAWLGQLMTTLGSLFPSWQHIEYMEAAAAVTRGTYVRELNPGVYFYWPFWTSIYTRPKVRQTKNLPTQSLVTLDRQRVVVGGMVRYEIANALEALIETHDVDAALVDESLAIICEYVTMKDLATIQANRRKVNTELTNKIRLPLEKYGVKIDRAQLTDFAPAVVLNHVGNFQTLPTAEVEE